jgi:hypothetical protein
MRQKLPSFVVYAIWLMAVGVIIMASTAQSGGAAPVNDRSITLPFPLSLLLIGVPLLIAFIVALTIWRARSTTTSGTSADPFAPPSETPARQGLKRSHAMVYLLFGLAVTVIIIASLIRQ